MELFSGINYDWQKQLDVERRKIQEMVKNVPDGKRIHIDKDLLEKLVFYRLEGKELIRFKGSLDDRSFVKIPVWTGPFLRKIDLSELSFENVFFLSQGEHFYDEKQNVVGNLNIGQLMKSKNIDFSGTNAVIDFSKVWGGYGVVLENCNFCGLDLSHAHGEYIKRAYNCNFSNTNVKINFNQPGCCFINDDFSNNDYSSIIINNTNRYFFPNGYVENCDFSNTGIQMKEGDGETIRLHKMVDPAAEHWQEAELDELVTPPSTKK